MPGWVGSGTMDQRTAFGHVPQHLHLIGSYGAHEDLSWRLAASDAVTARGTLHPLPSLQPTVVFSRGSHLGPADGTCPLSCGDATRCRRGPTSKPLSAHLVMERELGHLPALLRYLACMFVNHRSLCKQTHPQPSASHRPGNSAVRPSILFGCTPARFTANILAALVPRVPPGDSRAAEGGCCGQGAHIPRGCSMAQVGSSPAARPEPLKVEEKCESQQEKQTLVVAIRLGGIGRAFTNISRGKGNTGEPRQSRPINK